LFAAAMAVTAHFKIQFSRAKHLQRKEVPP
jgi:hypothetical protein